MKNVMTKERSGREKRERALNMSCRLESTLPISEGTLYSEAYLGGSAVKKRWGRDTGWSLGQGVPK